MQKVYTNNDLRVGMVLTCKNGSMYVVVADDNGHHDVLSLTGNDGKMLSNGLEVGNGKLAVCGGGKKGGRDIIRIQEFSACPCRNRLSEATKIATGHELTEELVTIWEAEDPEKEKAREKVLEAQARLNKAMADLEMAKDKFYNM